MTLLRHQVKSWISGLRAFRTFFLLMVEIWEEEFPMRRRASWMSCMASSIDVSVSSSWHLSSKWRRGATGSRTNAWIFPSSASAVFVSGFPEADLNTASNFEHRVCGSPEWGYWARIFLRSKFWREGGEHIRDEGLAALFSPQIPRLLPCFRRPSHGRTVAAHVSRSLSARAKAALRGRPLRCRGLEDGLCQSVHPFRYGLQFGREGIVHPSNLIQHGVFGTLTCQQICHDPLIGLLS